jgi:hypothetical protein
MNQNNLEGKEPKQSAEEILAGKLFTHKTLNIIPGSPLHIAVIDAMLEFATASRSLLPDTVNGWKIMDSVEEGETCVYKRTEEGVTTIAMDGDTVMVSFVALTGSKRKDFYKFMDLSQPAASRSPLPDEKPIK